MDNFDDFAPSSKSSSKLATLFGQDKGQQLNASLTYTAPKQPKKELSPKQVDEGFYLVISKTVFAYKLINSEYQTLGKVGLAIIGNPSPQKNPYLLMYTSSENVHCKLKINSSTVFSILENNYASFYVDSLENYSVKFDTSDDVKEVAKKFVQVKFFCSPLKNIICQDVKFGNGKVVVKGSTVSVKTTCYQSSDSQSEVLITSDVIDVIIGDENSYKWVAELEDMKYNGEKVIITRRNMSEPWTDKLAAGSNLVLNVELTESLQTSTEEKYEVKVDSSLDSADDSSSFKEKSAILEGALSSKSLKSGLLSRVARLGQPRLPLKGAIVADLTDSEDDSSPSPKPRTRSKPPVVTSRVSLPSKANDIHCDDLQKAVPSVPQPLALYQPQYHPQILMRNDSTSFGQIPTPTGNCLISPSDPSLPIYFAESRTQATELRMGITKLNDKIDMVLDKIQSNSNVPVQQITPSPFLDPTGLLSSLQNLVQENNQFKSKVEEQKIKIDTQNERIYNLLEMSHRSLEKNSSSVQNQAIDDKELESLKKELDEAQHLISNLNAQLATSQQNELDYKHKLTIAECQLIDLNSFKEKTEKLENKLIESDKKTSENELEQKNLLLIEIKTLTDENILLKNDTQELKNELSIIKTKETELEVNSIKIKQELIESQNLIAKLKNELIDCQTRLDSASSSTGNIENKWVEERSKLKELLEIKELKESESNEEKIKLMSQIQQLSNENQEIKTNLNSFLNEGNLKNAEQKIKKIEEVNLTKENELKEETNKLLTQIQQLTEENDKIKADLSKNIAAKTDISSTKILMNNLYRNLLTQFEVTDEYSGEAIKQILASSIREMTLQFLEQCENSPIKVGTPEPLRADKETINIQGSSPSVNVSKNTFYNVDSSSRSLPDSPETKSEKSHSSFSSIESPDKCSDAGAKNIEDCLDTQVAKEKDNAYNQIWQNSQPPPLPAFDEDEDDAW